MIKVTKKFKVRNTQYYSVSESLEKLAFEI